MCSSLLDFPLGVLTVVGEETVSAALHQHGEFDSDHLVKRAPHLFFLTVQIFLTSATIGVLNVVFISSLCVVIF